MLHTVPGEELARTFPPAVPELRAHASARTVTSTVTTRIARLRRSNRHASVVTRCMTRSLQGYSLSGVTLPRTGLRTVPARNVLTRSAEKPSGARPRTVLARKVTDPSCGFRAPGLHQCSHCNIHGACTNHTPSVLKMPRQCNHTERDTELAWTVVFLRVAPPRTAFQGVLARYVGRSQGLTKAHMDRHGAHSIKFRYNYTT